MDSWPRDSQRTRVIIALDYLGTACHRLNLMIKATVITEGIPFFVPSCLETCQTAWRAPVGPWVNHRRNSQR